MTKKAFKAGTYKQQYGYKSFSPNFINVPIKIYDSEINVLLEDATRFLGGIQWLGEMPEGWDFIFIIVSPSSHNYF